MPCRRGRQKRRFAGRYSCDAHGGKAFKVTKASDRITDPRFEIVRAVFERSLNSAGVACVGRLSARWLGVSATCEPQLQWEHDEQPLFCEDGIDAASAPTPTADDAALGEEAAGDNATSAADANGSARSNATNASSNASANASGTASGGGPMPSARHPHVFRGLDARLYLLTGGAEAAHGIELNESDGRLPLTASAPPVSR